jgi:hypothetical protein
MVPLRATNDPRRWQPVAMLMALSWLGEFVHNTLSLPMLAPLSPENSLPALVALALVVAWCLLRVRRVLAALTLGWAVTHLVVGAAVTVIPFPFLPFYPEQTVAHYLAHILYGVAQLPLIVAMIGHLRTPEVGRSSLVPGR